MTWFRTTYGGGRGLYALSLRTLGLFVVGLAIALMGIFFALEDVILTRFR